MKAKEYLMQYMLLKERQNDLQKQIEELKNEAESVRIVLDGMPRGTQISDRTGELASSLTDLTMRSISQRDAIWEKRIEICDTLAKLDDINQYKVLYKRYIDGDRWEKIAVETGYTYRHVTRIHGDALKSVQRILAE